MVAAGFGAGTWVVPAGSGAGVRVVVAALGVAVGVCTLGLTLEDAPAGLDGTGVTLGVTVADGLAEAGVRGVVPTLMAVQAPTTARTSATTPAATMAIRLRDVVMWVPLQVAM